MKKVISITTGLLSLISLIITLISLFSPAITDKVKFSIFVVSIMLINLFLILEREEENRDYLGLLLSLILFIAVISS